LEETKQYLAIRCINDFIDHGVRKVSLKVFRFEDLFLGVNFVVVIIKGLNAAALRGRGRHMV
jgi:hypothetical protein